MQTAFQTPLRPLQKTQPMNPPMAPRRPTGRPSPIHDEEKTSVAARALFHEVHGKEEQEENKMKEDYFYSVCRSLLFLPHDSSITTWVLYEDFLKEYNRNQDTSINKDKISIWLGSHHKNSTMIHRDTYERSFRFWEVFQRSAKIALFMRAGNEVFGKNINLLHTFPLYESWSSSFPKERKLNRYQRMILFMNKYTFLF